MAQLAIGTVLDGRYELRRQLGEGGIGTVHAAFDRLLEREVALKVLEFASPEALEAFRTEFATLSTTLHPGLPRSLDFSRARRARQLCFYTAELVVGKTLDRFAEGRAFSEVSPALADALDALAWLHELGIRHGDFKPPNVLVRDDGRGVLIDLSAASALRGSHATVSGTIGYLAPELVRDGRSDARSDLYSVGRTLQELLPRMRDVPAGIGDLVRRLTAADPAERPVDVVEVLAAIAPRRARHEVLRSVEPARLLGRDAELGAALELLEQHARAERAPRVIVLSGPPGSGKSRLFRELKWRAQLELDLIEGSAAGAGGLRALLARALGRPEIAAGLDQALSAREELARGPERRVLAIDDADRLPAPDQALLAALLRASAPDDALAWLLTASETASLAPEGAPRVSLGALDEAAITEWVRPHLSAARLDDVLLATGGSPRLLSELVDEVARGTLRESDLVQLGRGHGLDAALAHRVSALQAPAQGALAILAAMRVVADADARTLGLDAEALGELELAGLARWDAGELRLRDPHRRQSLLAALPAHAVGDALAGLLQRLPELARDASEERASQLVALEVDCRLLGGDGARAQTLALSARDRYEHAPQAWLGVARELTQRVPGALSWLCSAAAHEAVGDPLPALGALARALALRPAEELRSEIRWRAASCYEKLGRLDRALRELSRGVDERRAAPIQARCLSRKGAYAEAAQVAERALASGPDAELFEALGVALGYLGRQDEAKAQLDRAAELQTQGGSPRARVRVLSHRALFAYRAGQTEQAAQGFRDALEIAEHAGLGDLVANAALNLGTALHQSGDWGGASRSYERGLRAAVAFAKQRTELTLRFNLAKLRADIGLVELAESALDEVQNAAARAEARELSAALHGLRAELLLAQGRPDEARAQLDAARALHERRGSQRELLECDLQLAELELATASPDAAETALARSRARLDALDAADLALRARTVRGRIALERRDADAALLEMREASELLGRVGQLELRAELERLASEAYGQKAASALSDRHRLAAIECWERIASTLPGSWADAFWRHPRRRGMKSAASSGAADGRWQLALKVLEVNRRLSSTLDTEAVLRLALDSAIELTGAERGFLILRAGEGRSKKLEVAVARNLDRERIGKSHHKLSHGIAKRVIDSGEAVLSVDARQDERFFDNRSVHALRLRSIVCVPIRARGEVLGALYVDNRFERGRFGPEQAEMIGAFADQVAVALLNGRLLSELERRTRELEGEQARVASLMRSQADEIERLSHELERERKRVEPGRNYPEIVGRSAGIRRVLALLDKVVDSDVPVLVVGESGTGKELVARAIHFGGSRRDGPFVAVNCAALPEPLLESELFGHVRGAFTGAVRDHAGLFVSARGGTLFLDEIGDVSLALQTKLLRALQEREVRPVGADDVIGVGDVRVLSATNRRLREEAQAGQFRQDLYYRLSVIELELPPLRDRPEDVPLLAQAILDRLAEKQARPALRLSRGALAKLSSYAFPGNVRQLENVLARATVLADGDQIEAADLELPDLGPPGRRNRSRVEFRDNELERIRSALDRHRWNVCEVSRVLGIPRTSLYRKLARHGLLRARMTGPAHSDE